MNEGTVRQWIRKAENDLKIGVDEMSTTEPATDAVCFHMQQCAEKYLKAYLIAYGKEYPRTHNLERLVRLCADIQGDFLELAESGVFELTTYATDLRYGEEFYLPSVEEANRAIALAKRVRGFVRQKLQESGLTFAD